MTQDYIVMQVTETGEEFCAKRAYTYDEAGEWIDENADNYPESKFYIEHAAAFYDEGY